MSGDFDDDLDDDDQYFSEIVDGAEETGKEPKFVLLPALGISHIQMDEMRVDELVKIYIEMRNQLATDRKAFKQRQERIKTHMLTVSMMLLDRGDKFGTTSFATPMGTAFKRKTQKFQIADWDQFCKYVKETGNFHLLQKRVSPNAAKEVTETDGALPPGLATFEETTFAVRSPTARKSK
jgi:hypothetical protein